MPTGWKGGKPYLQPEFYVTDGMGTEHWRLMARCARCDEPFHVANIHGPLQKPTPGVTRG